uniref:Beta-lactamase-related domain-containing protein n=1 Tax=Mycena chlorophos TaxID=658473 RepID=A0ABQ0LH29_MYCCL|nr:predicted protein [Mycena chlorophos]
MTRKGNRDWLSPSPISTNGNGFRRTLIPFVAGFCLAWVVLRGRNNPPGPPNDWPLRPAPKCHPPLPNLFARSPIPQISAALDVIDDMVGSTYTQGGMDGLVVAVVTRDGAIYERAIGPLKANETSAEKRGQVDRHSIFRIASGSKLFTTLETLVLRERGALNLDDPIEKYLPGFSYSPRTWTGAEGYSGPITIRQLATHMSGLTREFPRGDMLDWPSSREGTGPPPTNGAPFPTLEETISGLQDLPLNLPTYSYPLYSNVGIALLGQVNVAASRMYEEARNESGSPASWPELAQRDLFAPLGLNGSGFLPTEATRAHIAVASSNSDEVDIDFLDVMSCSGGQMSSLSDYTKLMQTLLDPTLSQSLLPPQVIREWLHPIHSWFDDTTEVGLIWEIEKIRDAYERPVQIFQKLGVLGASRSVFAVNPSRSFGVALLMTGTSPAVGPLVLDIFRHLQPVLDTLLAERITSLYAGHWRNEDADSEVVITVDKGSLWTSKLWLRGSNVLEVVGVAPAPIALWSMGRLHEFR